MNERTEIHTSLLGSFLKRMYINSDRNRQTGGPCIGGEHFRRAYIQIDRAQATCDLFLALSEAFCTRLISKATSRNAHFSAFFVPSCVTPFPTGGFQCRNPIRGIHVIDARMLYSTRVLCCTMPNDDDDIVLIPPGGYPFTLYALRLPVVYTRCALARRGSFENMKMLLCI
ncbi:hypothetical protein OUZ56_021969 [Daphnia magna]|uniref:Uncharacterized protein n=1 Tax=Daphnia magna TaxID=35525 RepID=A0ABR0AUZ4_9CRUS|nr:hypothetical protein OUZ56_021969 [Daphnia magna]